MLHIAPRSRGFTLVELLITLAILALIGTMTVPVAEMVRRRAKERDLRDGLKELRVAIDAYKRAGEEGLIELPDESSGYPATLDLLVEGAPRRDDPRKGRVYFLRRVPRDPFMTDLSVPAARTWGHRSFDSEADAPREGKDVYDVYSTSTDIGINTIPYRLW